VSTPSPSPDRAGPGGEPGTHDSHPDGVSDADKARAGEALRASFARLSPQGSDEWNFMGAFTHLGDRFGPYRPGASDVADLLASQERGRRGGRLGRLRPGGPRPAGGPGTEAGERSEVEEAMTDVIEAFRFLHARVGTLEARLAGEDTPLDGGAWLVPARELGVWVEPVTAFVAARIRSGDVVHADCGEGALVRALRHVGVAARGVEPRGGVALRALETGCDVTIGELAEFLAQADAASLGGIVLSGVVDRLPLHALLPVLARSRQSLVDGAPLVVLAEQTSAGGVEQPVPRDLGAGKPLHVETWELLLGRSGFVDVTPLPAAPGDGRFGITAATPSS
jgi:hypothetical protein